LEGEVIIPFELQTSLFIFFDKDDNKTFEMIDTKGYYKVVLKVFELYKKRYLTPSIIEVDDE
jgi:hypothetical protein